MPEKLWVVETQQPPQPPPWLPPVPPKMVPELPAKPDSLVMEQPVEPEVVSKMESKPQSSLILQRLSRRIPPQDFLPHFCEVARVWARRAYAKQYLANRVEPGEAICTPSNSMGDTSLPDHSLMSIGDISFASSSALDESICDGSDNAAIIAAARLSKRLDDCGLRMEEVGDDGNCFFRAAAHQLYGNQEQHATVRERAVANLKEREDELQEFFGSKEDFEEYVDLMAMDRTWGDELALCAVAESYQCVVHVITSHQTNWYLVYTPKSLGKDGSNGPEEVFVAYIAPVHYNSVVLKKAVVEE